MRKKVITYPSRSLYKKCKNIDINSGPTIQMLDNLLDTFRVIQGYGLAAPQVGHSIRAFVINPIALGIEGSSEEVVVEEAPVKVEENKEEIIAEDDAPAEAEVAEEKVEE